MNTTEFHSMTQEPKLWSFPFALRTLLVFLTFCAVFGIGTTRNAMARRFCRHGRWVGASPRVDETQNAENVPMSEEIQRQHQRAQRSQEAVVAIRRTGEILSGGHASGEISHLVRFKNASVTDADLKPLKELDVPPFSALNLLYIGKTQVTDAGLEHLKGLSNLHRLWFYGTQITDAGLEALKGLEHLQELHLEGTKVTEAGVKKLQQALPNCKIEWEPPTKDDRQGPAAPDQFR
jgi:Leucine-rich repeat (LRR) protein